MKTAKFVLALALVPAFLWAQQVDEPELRAGSQPVEFTNYEGPHARIETREQIRGIGTGLGRGVAEGQANPGGRGRYFVIHSVTAGEEGRLDADIFGLGSDAGVDHVRNLRLVIQGYLQAAYGYSERDAATLATFVTVYNAVFRGNMAYLGGRYKAPVMAYLDQARAGLSTNYAEWPGRTLMLVPLRTGTSGSLSAIDTGSLAPPEVIQDMRSQDDRGLDSRRDMVDLLERESDQAAAQAQQQRQQAADQQAQVDQGRQQVQDERRQAAQEREQLAQQQQQGTVTPEEARRQEQQIAQREEAANRQEQQLDRQEQAAARQQEQADQSQALADQREQQAQDMRQDIARDQQQIIVQQDTPQAAPAGLIAVRIGAANTGLGRLVRLNASTGAQLRQGGMDTVNARTVVQAGGKIFAVAGQNQGGNQAIRLVAVNPDSLEMASQGDVDIHPQSLLWQNGDDLYAITVSGGQPKLARFNTSLARVAETTIAVHPLGAPLIQGDTVLMQRADGSVAFLNTADLSERRQQ